MSSIVYLKNKTNGKVYAYLNESIWDSKAKKCVCRRKCLGHVDPDTGDIVPNRGRKDTGFVTVKSIGIKQFLGRISEKIGLTGALKQAFPDNWKLILTCTFYNLVERYDMSNIGFWSMDNDTPFGKAISAQDITDMFSDITENNLFIFYREWRDMFTDDEFYMIHTSSISSYDKRSETIRFNDLPMTFVNPLTHLSITFAGKTGLPVTIGVNNRLPQNLTDIRRRETENSWLDMEKTIQVLDMDFCTDENLDDLFRSNHRFLIRSMPEFEFAKNSIENVKYRIMDLNNYITVDGEPFFVMSFMNYWKGKKCYVHIFYSTADAENEFSLFLSLIENCQKELKSGTFILEHEEFYKKYFLIRETPQGRLVEENGEAIMTYNNVAGFVVLISNSVKSSTHALRYYMKRDRVQKNFENLLNEKDRNNLKLYNESNYHSRLFLQFLSITLYTEINQRVKSYPPTSEMSFNEVMHEMSSLKRVTLPGSNESVLTNVSGNQAKILKAFGIDPDNLA